MWRGREGAACAVAEGGWEGAACAAGCRADVSAEDWEAEEAWEVVACAAECWLEEEDEAGWLSDGMALAMPAAMVWALK